MDNAIFYPSALLGLVFVAIYTVRCWKSGTKFSTSVMINGVLRASGIVCALFLIASTFIESIKTLISEMNLYIFIGGLALLSVSVRGIYRDLVKPVSEYNDLVNSNEDTTRKG